LKSDWAKGYSRLGAAYFGLRDYDKSIEAYGNGLKIDPANELLKSGLSEVEDAKKKASQGGGMGGGMGGLFNSPDVWSKLAANPATRGYLAQPDFVKMLQTVQANPDTIGNYMQDPRMMQVMGVLLGVNISTQMPDDLGKGESQEASAPPPKAPEPVPEPEPEMSADEKAAKAEKDAAQKEKELGNAAYKKKEFDTAIGHYNKAIELDSSDISFLTNRAAVYLEMEKYDECIKDCDDAVDKGREMRADYKMLARAMGRKGTALIKQGKMEEGIEAYNKSLMEHRTADVLTKAKAAEAQLKKQKELAYQDPALAEEERLKGNEFFKAGNFPDAVKHYTEAIKRNPADVKVYSNRAACYMKLAAFNEALKDADKCIEIDPSFPKGYTRKGAVQYFMKEYENAMKTYQEGLKHDPNNEELTNGVKNCVDQLNKGARGELSEDEMKLRQQKAMADPEIQGILQDPMIRQVLQDLQENPKAGQEALKDQMVMNKIQKLVNAGILQIR